MKTATMIVTISILLTVCAASAFASSCDSVLALKLPDTTITTAQLVPAGQFSPPGGGGRGTNPYRDLPEFCRVTATIKPTSDSDIKVEVWLPANGWNSKFPLEQWVEQGKAPEKLNASHSTNGKVDRTRPLCPYPQVAKYQGTGSIDDAANFACRMP